MAFPTIKLAFVVCRLADPTACHDVELVYSAEEENLTPMQCMMSAQQPLAEWLTQHPRYTIQRWRCEVDNGLYAKM